MADHMDHKEYYKDVMSKRDFDYFDTYSVADQQGVIEETRRQLHLSNVRRMKECVQGNRVTALMGLVSHVGRAADVCGTLLTEEFRNYGRHLTH
jgi:hypothetical protein